MFESQLSLLESTKEENYFNFGFSNGECTEFDTKGKKMVVKKFDPAVVKKGQIGQYNNGVFRCIQLQDKDGNVVLEAQRELDSCDQVIEFTLDEGERILGFQAH